MNIKQISKQIWQNRAKIAVPAVALLMFAGLEGYQHYQAYIIRQDAVFIPSRRAIERRLLQKRSSSRSSRRSLRAAHITVRKEVASPTLHPGQDAKPVVVRTAAPVLVLEDTGHSTPRSVQSSSRSVSIAVAPASVQTSSSVASAAARSVSPAVAQSGFPALERTVFPVSKVPNWGAMRSPAVWNRTYQEMTERDFVPVPKYDMDVLLLPMKELAQSPIPEENIPAITAKLFYSTKYFGAYDLDAHEFSAVHPGVDLKLAEGTPIGAIGGGRVHSVTRSDALGFHVMLEHRLQNGDTFYSIYGHLGSVSVSEGQDIRPGMTVGRVGMTGNTSAPHLHLQIDRKTTEELHHAPYYPGSVPASTEADRWAAHPIRFIARYSSGE